MEQYNVYNSRVHGEVQITTDGYRMIYNVPGEQEHTFLFNDDSIVMDEYRRWKIERDGSLCWKPMKTKVKTYHWSGTELFDDFNNLLIDNFATCWLISWLDRMIELA